MARTPRGRKKATCIYSVDELPLICTTAEAGLLLRCTPERVAIKAQNGEIPARKDGTHWLFLRKDLLMHAGVGGA